MDENTYNVKREAIDISAKDVHENLSEDFNALQQAAIIFLTEIINIYNNGSRVRIHRGGENEIMRLWSIYRDAATSRELALSQQRFSSALDKYLGRTIVLTYVAPDGQMYMYTEEGEAEILSKVGKNAGRANFNASAWLGGKKGHVPQQYQKLMDGEIDLIQKIHRSTSRRQEVYAEGIRRYNFNQSSKSNSSPEEKRRYYYKFNPPYHQFPPTGFSRGEVAEAYVNAVMKEDRDIKNDEMETSLQTLYEKYIASHKDNIPAIVKGDVVVNEEDGKISLAVKGQSASTAKIGQYIVAAHEISRMSMPPAEGVQKWLESLPDIATYAKRVEEEAQKQAGDYTDRAFEQILQATIINS